MIPKFSASLSFPQKNEKKQDNLSAHWSQVKVLACCRSSLFSPSSINTFLHEVCTQIDNTSFSVEEEEEEEQCQMLAWVINVINWHLKNTLNWHKNCVLSSSIFSHWFLSSKPNMVFGTWLLQLTRLDH